MAKLRAGVAADEIRLVADDSRRRGRRAARRGSLPCAAAPVTGSTRIDRVGRGRLAAAEADRRFDRRARPPRRGSPPAAGHTVRRRSGLPPAYLVRGRALRPSRRARARARPTSATTASRETAWRQRADPPHAQAPGARRRASSPRQSARARRVAGRRSIPSGLLQVAGAAAGDPRCGRTARRSAFLRGSITITRWL